MSCRVQQPRFIAQASGNPLPRTRLNLLQRTSISDRAPRRPGCLAHRRANLSPWGGSRFSESLDLLPKINTIVLYNGTDRGNAMYRATVLPKWVSTGQKRFSRKFSGFSFRWSTKTSRQCFTEVQPPISSESDRIIIMLYAFLLRTSDLKYAPDLSRLGVGSPSTVVAIIDPPLEVETVAMERATSPTCF